MCEIESRIKHTKIVRRSYPEEFPDVIRLFGA